MRNFQDSPLNPARHLRLASPPADKTSVLLLTALLVLLLVLTEWVFFVTKPSFLSALTWRRQLLVLGLSPLPLLAVAALALTPWLLAVTLRKSAKITPVFWALATLVPTAVLGSVYVLLVDNFTNTMWGLAIERSGGIWRIPVALGVLGLFYLAHLSVAGCLASLRRRMRVWAWVGGGLVAVSLLLLAAQLATSGGAASFSAGGRVSGLTARPNILILGSDGVNANHMSCYGYEKETTPYLESLMPTSLVCENFLTNCSHTTGSLTSLLTGRLPTETRVTYPPDILTGQDAYRHLPGILKAYGYRTAQISIRHYGDAYDLNLRDGFDSANFRRRETAQAASALSGVIGWEPSFFVEQIVDRIRVRLAHALGLNVLPGAFQEAQHADRLAGHTDAERYRGLQEILRETPEPFFAHAHFMGTHGSYFHPTRRKFSAGLDQDRGWIMEFYDDAIWEFDLAVRELLAVLAERGVLEHTIVVIYSDHGLNSNSRLRAPLLFRFPAAEFAGRIVANVQTVDIAPTLLDYLGAEIPTWMTGRSLLAGAPDPRRPVFSTRFREDILERVVDRGPLRVDEDRAGPPFFTIGSLIMVVGQRVFTLPLTGAPLEFHDLSDHTAPLPVAELPTATEAAAMMLAHLAAQGYDVSGLDPAPVPER